MKETIKNFVLQLDVDDVGFASIDNYNSPRSPKMEDVFPDAQTIIVMVSTELSHYSSPNTYMRGFGRNITSQNNANHCFKLARFLEKEYKAQAMLVPSNYPLNMSRPGTGFIGEVSLRHAAIAAGLGAWGRNNLVIHPRLGAQILFSAVLTDLKIEPDQIFTEELCNNCNICIEECPVQALDQENFTDALKCIRHSQPYGLSNWISFWAEFSKTAPEEQKKLLFSDKFMQLSHTMSFGTHYHCFNCYASCPLGK